MNLAFRQSFLDTGDRRRRPTSAFIAFYVAVRRRHVGRVPAPAVDRAGGRLTTADALVTRIDVGSRRRCSSSATAWSATASSRPPSSGASPTAPARRGRRGAPPGLRPGAPVLAVRRRRRRRPRARRRRALRPTRRRARPRRPGRRTSTPAPASATTAGGRTHRLRRLRARHRLVRRSSRRSPAPTPTACSSTARSTTSTRSGPGRRAAAPASSSAAACSGSRRPTPCACSGCETTVVEFAPRLMAVQLDDGGGRALRRHVEALGLDVRTGRGGRGGAHGRRRRGRAGWRSPRAPTLDADLVVFAAGIRPRDQLARDAGLGRRRARRRRRRRPLRHVRPGRLRRSARSPATGGRVYGLVAPGLRRWPTWSSPTWPAATPRFTGADTVDAAQAARRRRGQRRRPARRRATRSSSPTRRRRCGRRSSSTTTAGVLGAVLVGDTRPYRHARAVRPRARPGAADVLAPAAPGRRRPAAGAGRRCPTTPASARATTCRCGAIRAAVRDGCEDVAGVKALHEGGHRLRFVRAGAAGAARRRARPAGRTVRRAAVRPLRLTRPELFEVVRVSGIRTLRRARRPPRHRAGAARSASRPWRRCSRRCRRATSSTASRPACRTPTTTSSPTSSATAPTRWSPGCPGGEITPGAADRHRRGRPRLRPLHEDHRRPAHRPARRPGRAAAGHLGPARRRRPRVGPRLRQGGAHGEVVRRHDAGAATACRTRCSSPSTSSSATGACARPTRSSWRCPAAPGSAPRRRARTSA